MTGVSASSLWTVRYCQHHSYELTSSLMYLLFLILSLLMDNVLQRQHKFDLADVTVALYCVYLSLSQLMCNVYSGRVEIGANWIFYFILQFYFLKNTHALPFGVLVKRKSQNTPIKPRGLFPLWSCWWWWRCAGEGNNSKNDTETF